MSVPVQKLVTRLTSALEKKGRVRAYCAAPIGAVDVEHAAIYGEDGGEVLIELHDATSRARYLVRASALIGVSHDHHG